MRLPALPLGGARGGKGGVGGALGMERVQKEKNTTFVADYGMLDLFATSGKQTNFLDALRHHFALQRRKVRP